MARWGSHGPEKENTTTTTTNYNLDRKHTHTNSFPLHFLDVSLTMNFCGNFMVSSFDKFPLTIDWPHTVPTNNNEYEGNGQRMHNHGEKKLSVFIPTCNARHQFLTVVHTRQNPSCLSIPQKCSTVVFSSFPNVVMNVPFPNGKCLRPPRAPFSRNCKCDLSKLTVSKFGKAARGWPQIENCAGYIMKMLGLLLMMALPPLLCSLCSFVCGWLVGWLIPPQPVCCCCYCCHLSGWHSRDRSHWLAGSGPSIHLPDFDWLRGDAVNGWIDGWLLCDCMHIEFFNW